MRNSDKSNLTRSENVTPLIFGHRGAAAVAPENTLISFQAAFDAGAEGIEFDVQLAADGEPVCLHDETPTRTATMPEGAARVRWARVKDCAVAELQKIDVGSWFNAKFPALAQSEFAGAGIPTLREVFARYGGKAFALYLEMKCYAPILAAPLARAVAELTREYGLAEQVAIKSFTHEAIMAVKDYAPELRTVALFEPSLRHPLLNTANSILERAQRARADEISVHYSLATKKLIRLAHAANFKLAVWTVDNPRWLAKGKRYGVDVVISNNPAALLAERARLA